MENNLEYIISKFKEGDYMYNNSPTFNKCTRLLMAGADVYHLLEQVITHHDECVRNLQEIINNGLPSTIIVFKNEHGQNTEDKETITKMAKNGSIEDLMEFHRQLRTRSSSIIEGLNTAEKKVNQ